MNHPKISVILPCYNHADFLEERIRAVLAQTLPVSQIIFLDDASTDDSLNLARSLLLHAAAEVSFHSNACNSGSPFIQWNKGFALAKHPYVWIAETDDTCGPDLLAKLYTQLKNTSVAIAFSQSRYIDSCGNNLGSALAYTDAHWPGFFAKDFIIPGPKFNSKFMAVINAVPNASAVLLNASALGNAGLANESMQFCGDWDFWIRISEQGNVAFIADELNGFRCHQHTSRVKHHTPQASAEFLACRLRAHLGGRRSNGVLTLRRLIQLLNMENRRALILSFNAISWGAFRQVIASYRLIGNIPFISPAAWVVIGMMIFVKYLYGKVWSFKQRAALFRTRMSFHC